MWTTVTKACAFFFRVGECLWIRYVLHQGGGHQRTISGRSGPQTAGQQFVSHQGQFCLPNPPLKHPLNAYPLLFLQVFDGLTHWMNVSSVNPCVFFLVSRRWTSTQWNLKTWPSPRPSACRSSATTTSTPWLPTSTLSLHGATSALDSPPVSSELVLELGLFLASCWIFNVEFKLLDFIIHCVMTMLF